MEPQIGDRAIIVCEATGEPVEMEYTGTEESPNGHLGWLCLHQEDE